MVQLLDIVCKLFLSLLEILNYYNHIFNPEMINEMWFMSAFCDSNFYVKILNGLNFIINSSKSITAEWYIAATSLCKKNIDIVLLNMFFILT